MMIRNVTIKIIFLFFGLMVSGFSYSQSIPSCTSHQDFIRTSATTLSMMTANCANNGMKLINPNQGAWYRCAPSKVCSCQSPKTLSENDGQLICVSPQSSSSSVPSSCPEGFTLVNGMCAQNVSAPEQCIFPYEHVDGICLLDNAECSNGQTGISVVVDLATGATQCSAHTNSSSAPTSEPSSSPSSEPSSDPANSSTPFSSSAPQSSANSSANASSGGDGNGGGDGDGNGSGSGSSSGNGGGSGDGGSSGSTSSSNGNAQGGDCSAAPSCDGDAIQCAILEQIWRGQCDGLDSLSEFNADESYESYEASFNEFVDESKNSDLIDDDGVLKILQSEEIDLSQDDRFGISQLETIANSSSNGSCPAPRTLEIALGSFEVSYSFFCDLAEELSGYVLFLFAFISSKIIFRSLAG